jgi:hypothetical protein
VEFRPAGILNRRFQGHTPEHSRIMSLFVALSLAAAVMLALDLLTAPKFHEKPRSVTK